MGERNILIIDDEPHILEILSEYLGEFSSHIETTDSGIEALALLEEKEYDLIICDIKMPKMGGIEIIKEVRSRGLNTKFIFFTGHGNEALMMESLKYGAFGFVHKPNYDNLESLAEKALKSSCSSSDHEEIKKIAIKK